MRGSFEGNCLEDRRHLDFNVSNVFLSFVNVML